MADNINDKELEELNEIYRQKMEALKNSPKHEHEHKNKKVKTVVKAESSEKSSDKKNSKSDSVNVDDRKKKLAIRINIGVCTAFFAITAICLIVLPRPTVSETEKRNLATFPDFTWEAYWSGDYAEDISYFFNDTVPFRDTFKSIGATFRSLFGFSIDGAELNGTISQVNSGNSQTEVTTQSTKPIQIVIPQTTESSDSTPAQTDENSSQTGGTDETSSDSKPKPDDNLYTAPSDPGAVIVAQSGTQIAYVGSDGNVYGAVLYNGNRSNAEDYAYSVNTIKEKLPDTNVYSMLALTQSTFITPSELSITDYTELSDSVFVSNMLSKDIKVIDTLETLLPHKDEDIFFLRDCHWQQLGAYYAAESFAKTAGVKFADLKEYDEYGEYCRGSVYAATQYDGLSEAYEMFNFYVPKNKYTTEYYNSKYEYQFEYPLMPTSDYNRNSFYSLFMVADSYIKHITTDAGNGRVLVVLKDDYPSAMVPCLTSSFEEIYVIDVRYCDFNVIDFCKEHGATDVLIGMTTESALGEIGDTLSYLVNLQ